MRLGEHIHSAKTVWLFGNAAEYASDHRGSKLIFVAPPKFFEFPSNTEKVYLKRFQRQDSTNYPVKYY